MKPLNSTRKQSFYCPEKMLTPEHKNTRIFKQPNKGRLVILFGHRLIEFALCITNIDFHFVIDNDRTFKIKWKILTQALCQESD